MKELAEHFRANRRRSAGSPDEALSPNPTRRCPLPPVIRPDTPGRSGTWYSEEWMFRPGNCRAVVARRSGQCAFTARMVVRVAGTIRNWNAGGLRGRAVASRRCRRSRARRPGRWRLRSRRRRVRLGSVPRCRSPRLRIGVRCTSCWWLVWRR